MGMGVEGEAGEEETGAVSRVEDRGKLSGCY